MWTLELPWETWRAIIDALRNNGEPGVAEHAGLLERNLDRYARR